MTSNLYDAQCGRAKFADMVVAAVVSAAAASAAFVPLSGLGVAIADRSFQALAFAFFGLLAIPFTLCAFLIGSLIVGPSSYVVLNRLRMANQLSAGLTAAVFSGASGWLFLGQGAPDGNAAFVTPIALAGLIGGVVFSRWISRRPKPLPVPPSAAPTPGSFRSRT